MRSQDGDDVFKILAFNFFAFTQEEIPQELFSCSCDQRDRIRKSGNGLCNCQACSAHNTPEDLPVLNRHVRGLCHDRVSSPCYACPPPREHVAIARRQTTCCCLPLGEELEIRQPCACAHEPHCDASSTPCKTWHAVAMVADPPFAWVC